MCNKICENTKQIQGEKRNLISKLKNNINIYPKTVHNVVNKGIMLQNNEHFASKMSFMTVINQCFKKITSYKKVLAVQTDIFY